jgi:hypothetical protein
VVAASLTVGSAEVEGFGVALGLTAVELDGRTVGVGEQPARSDAVAMTAITDRRDDRCASEGMRE